MGHGVLRLYFLSNDELLDLLSSGRKVADASRHLGKLFPALAGLEADAKGTAVVAVSATDGHRLPIPKPVSIPAAKVSTHPSHSSLHDHPTVNTGPRGALAGVAGNGHFRRPSQMLSGSL